MSRRRHATHVPSESLGRLRLRLTAWYVGNVLRHSRAVEHRNVRDDHPALRCGPRCIVARGHARVDSRRATARHDARRRRITAVRSARRSANSRARPVHRSTRSAHVEWRRARSLVARSGARCVAPALGERRFIAPAANDSFARTPTRSWSRARGTLVAIAVADEIELEDRYASLIAAFSAAALAAVVLVAVGGWLLARKSTQPVEEPSRTCGASWPTRRTSFERRSRSCEPAPRWRCSARASRDEYTRRAPRNRARDDAPRPIGRGPVDSRARRRRRAAHRSTARFSRRRRARRRRGGAAIADRKRVRLEVADFEEAPVHGDPALLRQLVMILLDNAIKFTPPARRVRVQVISDAGASRSDRVR